MPRIRTVVFDLGGVLIDWDPRHLYRKLFPDDEAAMELFLAEVCTPAWNEEQDGGRSFAEGIAALRALHPQHRELIDVFWERWEEMIPGPIDGAPAVLRQVKETGRAVYALSNWSAETWPIAQRRFDFLSLFDGIVISGQIGLRKPDPAIYRHLLETHSLEAGSTLFIDDSEPNVEAAREVGLEGLRFTGVPSLRAQLAALGVLPAVVGS